MRFPVTRPPIYERVTPPHNEQTIDPLPPLLRNEARSNLKLCIFCKLPNFSSRFPNLSKFPFFTNRQDFLFFWIYSKTHLISIDIFLLYYYIFSILSTYRQISQFHVQYSKKSFLYSFYYVNTIIHMASLTN